MNLASHLFPGAWLWFAAALAGGLLLRSVRLAPWQRLRGDSAQLDVWLGMVVALMVLWQINAGVKAGLNLHLVGAAAATLMFGPHLALLAMAAVLAASTFNGDVSWQAFGLNLLVMCAPPVLLAQRLRRLVEKYLPANYFIYIFVLAFAGSGLGVIAVGLLATGVLGLAGAYPLALLLEEYLPFFLLLAFSEAWLTGMTMTLMVIYRPGWVASFDDARYLARK